MWSNVAVALAVLALSWWGGRILAYHYSDGWEVTGALVVAGSLVLPGAIWGQDALPIAAVACAVGLISGYERREVRRAPREERGQRDRGG